jgi:hypothetical protein
LLVVKMKVIAHSLQAIAATITANGNSESSFRLVRVPLYVETRGQKLLPVMG